MASRQQFAEQQIRLGEPEPFRVLDVIANESQNIRTPLVMRRFVPANLFGGVTARLRFAPRACEPARASSA
jgi:hypothetical protein